MEKKKCFIFDVSFYNYSSSFGQRRKCTRCNGEVGNFDCPECEGSGQAYLSHNGIRTGGLYGVLGHIIPRLRDGYEVIVPFDPPKENLDRTFLLDSYKGNRPPVPDWIKYQARLLEEILPLTKNIQCLRSDRSESDDVMAAVAVKKSEEGYYVVLASDDKDMMPVLAYDNINLFRQKEIFTKEDFIPWLKKKYDIKFDDPMRFSEFLAIAGDAADNYKGINGLGSKAAEYFINKYDRVDNLWCDWQNIEDKYKKKLVKSCAGTTCKKCTHTSKKPCTSRGDKLTYLIDELRLSLRIADLELDAKYYSLNKTPDKDYIKSVLEKHGLRNALSNIDLLF